MAVSRASRPPKPSSGRSRRGHSRLYWQETNEGYLFILPVVLGLIIFVFGPMIASVYYSLTEYSILKAPEFIGFRNYVDMFTRPNLRAPPNSGRCEVVLLPLQIIFLPFGYLKMSWMLS